MKAADPYCLTTGALENASEWVFGTISGRRTSKLYVAHIAWRHGDQVVSMVLCAIGPAAN